MARTYTGPEIPTQYDPTWNGFGNLTPAQKAWFESQPQDLITYTSQSRWQYENRVFPNTMQPMPASYVTIGNIPIYLNNRDNRDLITGLALDAQMNPNDTYNITVQGTVVNMTATQAVGLFNGVRSYIQQCRDIEATMIGGINAKTITTRAQIDAAFAVLN